MLVKVGTIQFETGLLKKLIESIVDEKYKLCLSRHYYVTVKYFVDNKTNNKCTYL